MENNLETAKDANQLVNCSFLHPLHMLVDLCRLSIERIMPISMVMMLMIIVMM